MTIERAISDVNQIPDGEVLSQPNGIFPLSPDQMQNMCVLRTGKYDLFLASEQVSTTGTVIAMMKRFRTEKATASKTLELKKIVVTQEVLRLVYLRDNSRQSNTKGEEATDTEVLISRIVTAAHLSKASDIHIESRVVGGEIYFRVNGSRQLFLEITHSQAYALGNCMYSVHADAGSKDISWNPEDVQDGAFVWKTDTGEPYQFRFSSSPIYPQKGFQIVLRMISIESSTSLPLTALGYDQHMIDQIDVMTSASSGMVLLCGATNSGKSTSMQAIINLIYEKRGKLMKIITVEDPVEYVIPGACQISVPRRRTDATDNPNNTAFTRFLRGTLRQDPDIVMVGEIRDNSSASIVKDSVLAGRKLLTTIHTYSTFGAFLRLREIGVPWEILTMPLFFSGLIYQRLVPTLCRSCSVHIKDAMSANPEGFSRTFLARLNAVVDIESENVRVEGPGCASCNQTGTSGRTVCAEFNIPSRPVLKLLSENKMLEAEAQWRNEGGFTALDHAISKMKQGTLSPFKIEENISLLVEGVI